jgi:murein DD-endopeptidase MepM/ murein hydrolase activator NlpD
VDGVVEGARDDLPDLEGAHLEPDPQRAAVNRVVLRSDAGPFVRLAHLRAGTVAVEPGQWVAVGELLGEVGTSGDSTLPHLHLQAQTHADRWDPDHRSLPFAFADGWVPARNDRVAGLR